MTLAKKIPMLVCETLRIDETDPSFKIACVLLAATHSDRPREAIDFRLGDNFQAYPCRREMR